MATSQERYRETIMKAGEQDIIASHPDATDLRYISTRDFLRGKLTQIEFAYDQGKRGYNLIYDHDGQFEYFRNEQFLVQSLGKTQPQAGTLEFILKPENIAGIIALLLAVAAIGLAVFGKDVPFMLSEGFALVLGYFFGKKV
jgi:hypothetical protein